MVMIQKRTTTCVSFQPDFSKWWCSGAMRNTRFPVSLKDATWMMTDSVSSTNNPLVWQQKSISLAAYAGQTVKLAWRYGSDGGVDREGWYVDDIALTHAQVPGTCAALPDPLFSNGFE